MKDVVRGRPHGGGALPTVQTLIQEVRDGILLLRTVGEEEDHYDKLVILLRGVEGQELLGRGKL